MAEFYPLLFGRGFSLPQLLFFLLLLLTLVQGPSTGPQGRRRFASPWGRPAAAVPARDGSLGGPRKARLPEKAGQFGR